MFLGERRHLVEAVILARTDTERRQALDALLPLQRDDFTVIPAAVDGLPVTIRLLDPSLHEFLPDRTEQPPYSLPARGVERHLLPVARRLGMGVLTWSPPASGFLTGRYRKGRALDLSSGRPTLHPDRFDPSAPRTAAKLEAVERLVAVAEEAGCTLPELAVAFPLAHPAVTSVIIGPRTMEQLRSTLKGTSVVLDDAVLDRIDEIARARHRPPSPGRRLDSADAHHAGTPTAPGRAGSAA